MVAFSFVEISAFSPVCIVQIIPTHRPVKYLSHFFHAVCDCQASLCVFVSSFQNHGITNVSGH